MDGQRITTLLEPLTPCHRHDRARPAACESASSAILKLVTSKDLPDDVDPELWFDCVMGEGGRDYFTENPWHTFPGRMSAWCDEGQFEFRVSKNQLPETLPVATTYWVRGFLTGNVPRQPTWDYDDDPALVEWNEHARDFLQTGTWPVEGDVE